MNHMFTHGLVLSPAAVDADEMLALMRAVEGLEFSGASDAIAGGSVMPAPKPPARTVTHRAPPKPNSPKHQVETMSAAEFNTAAKAIVNEQRRAFFDARPHLPQHLCAGLQGETMERIRKVVSAWEGKALDAVEPDLRAIDRAMGLDCPPAVTAVRRGHTLYLGGTPPADSEELALARIDRAMGIAKPSDGKCELRGNTLYLGGAPQDD